MIMFVLKVCEHLTTQISFGLIPDVAVSLSCLKVVHGQVMNLKFSFVIHSISASAGVGICLANLAKDQIFL